MENSTRAPQAFRFVVEDSITKVTSDGQPHGMMIILASLSGLIAAVVILAILIPLVTCKKQKRKNNNNPPGRLSTATTISTLSCNFKRPSLASNFSSSTRESNLDIPAPAGQYTTISELTVKNLEGHLNSPMKDSYDFIFHDFPKNEKKHTRWLDEIESSIPQTAETVIDIGRH